MFNNEDFILVKSTQLLDLFLKDFYAVIVIEEFSTTAKVCKTSLLLRKFKGRKVLILTEFINEKNKTLNSFDNILRNEYIIYLKFREIVSFLSKNSITSFILYQLSIFIEYIKTFRSVILQKIPGIFFRVLVLSISILFLPFINLIKHPYIITKFIRLLAVKFRKIRFKGESI